MATNSTEIDSIVGSATTVFSRILKSPAFKAALIGVLIVLLLIPTLMIWFLLSERQNYQRQVESEIAQGWGNSQTVNGPYIAVPYYKSISSVNDKGQQVRSEKREFRFFSAEQLDIKTDVDVTVRAKAIFKTPVYRSETTLSGAYKPLDLAKHVEDQGRFDANNAFMVLEISDVRAIKNDVILKRRSKADQSFRPGLKNFQRDTGSSGIHLDLSADDLASGFDFSIDLILNGSRVLGFAPSGQTTKTSIKGNWPDPSFGGLFLPDQRKITDKGFEASWSVPFLARGIDASVKSKRIPLSTSVLTVSLIKPLDFYQSVSRVLKYAIGLIAMCFLVVFVLEVTSGTLFHWIQYMLLGFSLVVFYVLLLAFAEQIGFAKAYIVSAIATVALIGAYVASITGKPKQGLIVGLGVSVALGFFFFTVLQRDYALLVGAIIAFVGLAILMFATRRVDWRMGAAKNADA